MRGAGVHAMADGSNRARSGRFAKVNGRRKTKARSATPDPATVLAAAQQEALRRERAAALRQSREVPDTAQGDFEFMGGAEASRSPSPEPERTRSTSPEHDEEGSEGSDGSEDDAPEQVRRLRAQLQAMQAERARLDADLASTKARARRQGKECSRLRYKLKVCCQHAPRNEACSEEALSSSLNSKTGPTAAGARGEEQAGRAWSVSKDNKPRHGYRRMVEDTRGRQSQAVANG